jgi:hypothetical protein
MKMRITWTETATYCADIETDLTPEQLEEEVGDGSPVWFGLVDEQIPTWATDNLREVSERDADSIARVAADYDDE